LNIEGNSKCNKGLSVYHSKYSNISNVKVQNMGNENINNIGGIELIGDCSFSNIRDCKIFNMISSSEAFGIIVSSDNNAFSKHCLIDNCLIDTVVPSDDSDGIKFLQLGMPSYSTVSNCTILNCDKRAIKVQTEFVDIYNCYCEGKMGYAGIDFQCGNGTATDCTLKFTKQYYSGVCISGANARLKNIKILNDTYDSSIMSSAIRIDELYSSIEDSFGDIILDNVCVNTAQYALLFRVTNIQNIKNLKILNMTAKNIYQPYMFQFNNGQIDFLHVENLNILNLPTPYYNIFGNPIVNNCNIRNNITQGWRFFKETAPISNNNVMYIEDIDDDYYVPYIQQGLQRKYKNNIIPSNQGGGKGDIFRNSKKGDVCENTDIKITTSSKGDYIVTGWVCITSADEENIRGTWKELKQYI
jgi:hypothetical protein